MLKIHFHILLPHNTFPKWPLRVILLYLWKHQYFLVLISGWGGRVQRNENNVPRYENIDNLR